MKKFDKKRRIISIIGGIIIIGIILWCGYFYTPVNKLNNYDFLSANEIIQEEVKEPEKKENYIYIHMARSS